MTLRRTTAVLLAALALAPSIAHASPVPDPPDLPSSIQGSAQDTTGVFTPQQVERATDSTSMNTLFGDLFRDIKHLPSWDSLVVASVGGGLALAAHPIDDTFNQQLANDGGFFKLGDTLGSTGVLVGVSTGAWAAGDLTGHPRVAHVGLDMVRAELVSEAMVQTLKYTVQRPRPDGSSGYSFPSGHSAATFAIATVIERHHGIAWAIPTYAFASYVAMSRLHDNVHNLSDVVFGAAVGTIAGRTVTRHGHSNFAMIPIATPGGAAILFTRNMTP